MRRLTALVFDKNVFAEKEPKQIHPLAKITGDDEERTVVAEADL
jgi:hypothetical protein